ncbi:antirestriction protein ArdA [Caulobacter sp. RHG1]|uniref:antirestriction protein ArdA n=1 Tax=Caulobacter sp. (strain RHG1) TaxID=2545762 RepID=UPI001552B11E|nr:antirestriction protein ArdA [Caulobacter sp. RHG1]NQE61404.1 putative antirestriction protein [Caulobacter sp. RHG1]
MGQAAENLEPRIYVACLAAYNSGRLHGAWIDVEDDADAVRGAIAAMLRGSPEPDAEEWAIHDYEDFGGVQLSEYAAIDAVVAIAVFLRERGGLGALVLAHVGGDLEAAAEALDEQYCGVFARLADYLQDLTEETVTIPEALRSYIDYEAMARDAEINGDFFTVETGHDEVHVFHGR